MNLVFVIYEVLFQERKKETDRLRCKDRKHLVELDPCWRWVVNRGLDCTRMARGENDCSSPMMLNDDDVDGQGRSS